MHAVSAQTYSLGKTSFLIFYSSKGGLCIWLIHSSEIGSFTCHFNSPLAVDHNAKVLLLLFPALESASVLIPVHAPIEWRRISRCICDLSGRMDVEVESSICPLPFFSTGISQEKRLQTA